jgi:mRNA-degrading endonuclease YafQ of YafQ-DinJ toxin-antitoxin module
MKTNEITETLLEHYSRLTEDADVRIIKSKMFKKSHKKILRDPQVVKAFNKFLDIKMDNPTAVVGNSDYPFSGNNILGGGVMHCGLTRDISVIYMVHGRNPVDLHLIEIGSHRDFGTGTPGNINKFKSLATRIKNYRSDVGI